MSSPSPQQEAKELKESIAKLEKQLASEKEREKQLVKELGVGKGEGSKGEKKGKEKGKEKGKDTNKEKEQKSDEDKMVLQGAVMGEVCTRFPPEASGYMHIGHAKAAMTNFRLAKKYNGRMVFRFDDTNPKKEDAAFEASIVEDTKSLGIEIDKITYTSDRFEEMLELAERMVKEGKAYCDDTDPETIKKERMDGIPSKCRDNTVEQNLSMWENMKAGTAQGVVLRAKMFFDDPNKCLRDPVLYRVVDHEHIKTGKKFKAYPTYDFACPIVDSLDGVTHALRTSEYNDRNPQYHWILDALNMRKPMIEDFSRLNMEFTVMSKRKLAKFVEDGLVDGWNDPRFPTVKGLLRRGLTVKALENFIESQGMSRANNFQEWGMLWTTNCRVIDPEKESNCKRYTCIARDACVAIDIEGAPEPEVKDKLWHKKNEKLGTKKFHYAGKVLTEEEDMILLKDGEEFTLMDWGNVILKEHDAGPERKHMKKATTKLHLEGDFKKTKYKLTWLADCPENKVPIELQEFEHLITTVKPDPEIDIESVINRDTKAVTWAWGEAACKEIKKGDIVQFERRGYFICDAVEPHLVMIYIPDGKVKRPHLSAWSRRDRLAGKTQAPAQMDERGMSLEEKRAKKKAQKAQSAAAPKGGLDASNLDIRVGKILEIGPHPDADALFVEKIDLGEEGGPRTVVSGLRKYYEADALQGKSVAVLCNLKPAAMRGVESCGMVLCASTEDKSVVEVLSIPENVPVGERVTFPGFPAPGSADELPKKKVPELLSHLNTDENGHARWKEAVFTTSAGPVSSTLQSQKVG